MLYSQLQEVDVLSRDSVSPKDRSTDYFRKRNKLNRNTTGEMWDLYDPRSFNFADYQTDFIPQFTR